MKSWIGPALCILTPLTLALAISSGVATMKSAEWARILIPATFLLSLGVIVLGYARLVEIRKLQQAGSRTGQILGTMALLLLFLLAVGVFFFGSCTMDFIIEGH